MQMLADEADGACQHKEAVEVAHIHHLLQQVEASKHGTSDVAADPMHRHLADVTGRQPAATSAAAQAQQEAVGLAGTHLHLCRGEHAHCMPVWVEERNLISRGLQRRECGKRDGVLHAA